LIRHPVDDYVTVWEELQKTIPGWERHKSQISYVSDSD